MNKLERQNFNYHSHTYRCKHASKTAMDKDYVDAAIRAGYTSMAFTDHVPLREELDFNENMRMVGILSLLGDLEFLVNLQLVYLLLLQLFYLLYLL